MSGSRNNVPANEFEPSEFYLGQNYPNPFKDITVIKYCLPYRTKVVLTIYNSRNEKVKKFAQEKEAGTYKVEINTEQDLHPNLNHETYRYCLEAGTYKSEKQMELKK